MKIKLRHYCRGCGKVWYEDEEDEIDENDCYVTTCFKCRKDKSEQRRRER